MATSPHAGTLPDPSMLVDVERLLAAYQDLHPDAGVPEQRVAFGTSGHRGSPLRSSFNEDHILAITQALCDYRTAHGIDGPVFVGIDTHAVSAPAFATVVEVLVANQVEVMIARGGGATPTPVVSHAILTHNRGREARLADGIVVSPSHNPPEDGGIKYNPPNGGPADAGITGWVEKRANSILAGGVGEVARTPFAQARRAPGVREQDFIGAYVSDLPTVVDVDAIRAAGVRIGVDPLGGAGLDVWEAVAARWGPDITIVNRTIDPTFRFMTLDWDGRIRMDCSSPYAMARLVSLADSFDVAVANDTDADRHGVVVPRLGLLNPNHYLSVAVDYLFRHRSQWSQRAAVGKTVVTTTMIDRIAADLGRDLFEVPVGFKWFVEGLLDGSVGFGGEESAGASHLRHNGTVWTTDKDGIVLALLAAEMTAVSGRNPGELYGELTQRFGAPAYRRIDAPATPEQKVALGRLSPERLRVTELAGDRIVAVLTTAPGNGAPIGGLKVTTERGWFAARPSGTEDVYKIYAESFAGEDHLSRILEEAQQTVDAALGEGAMAS